MVVEQSRSIGQAIDGVIEALTGLSEDAQIVAIRAACDALKLSYQSYEDKSSRGGAMPALQSEIGSPKDIRTLKETKSPNSIIEMACIVAYYLEHIAIPSEQKFAINSDDIKKYFIQANYPVPKAAQQVLIDAKGAGYFDAADERGYYKLNAVGYNLVVHTLPREGGAQRRRRVSKESKKR